MLRPSRVVEQMQGIPFFVGKGPSECSVCGRPLTARKSVARGIGPVCVRKHMGPGSHPSGSPQSVHAGGRAVRRTLSELVKMRPSSSTMASTGIERARIDDYGEDGKVLSKTNLHGLAESEVMAYEFSKSLGWDIVPETVMSDVPLGALKNVSAQRWIENSSMPYDLPESELLAFRKDDRMVVMDALLGNFDRHMNNIVVDEAGKQWAIDNNRAFRRYERMYRFGRGVTKDRAGLIDAAKDVRRWFKTPAYREYVAKLEKTHGKSVARRFGLNVADLVDWSRKARVTTKARTRGGIPLRSASEGGGIFDAADMESEGGGTEMDLEQHAGITYEDASNGEIIEAIAGGQSA